MPRAKHQSSRPSGLREERIIRHTILLREAFLSLLLKIYPEMNGKITTLTRKNDGHANIGQSIGAPLPEV